MAGFERGRVDGSAFVVILIERQTPAVVGSPGDGVEPSVEQLHASVGCRDRHPVHATLTGGIVADDAFGEMEVDRERVAAFGG